MVRRDLTFESGGVECAAWLYLPPSGGGDPGTATARPCVVMGHGFGLTRVGGLARFAERFRRAGLAVLVFDYRHFGDSGGDPRQLLEVRRQLDDWRAAIAYARSLPEVDARQLIAWGYSLGGGHVMTIAAEDDQLAGAITQNPFADGLWALRAVGPANMARLTAAGLRDELGRLRRRPAHRLAIVGPPGSVGALTSPGALEGYRAVFDDGVEWENWVAARIALWVGLYRPGRRAADIRCPWLVQVCTGDAVTPARPAVVAATHAPRSQVRRYEGGHFTLFEDGAFERAVGDQLAFLERVLPGLQQPTAAAAS